LLTEALNINDTRIDGESIFVGFEPVGTGNYCSQF